MKAKTWKKKAASEVRAITKSIKELRTGLSSLIERNEQRQPTGIADIQSSIVRLELEVRKLVTLTWAY